MSISPARVFAFRLLLRIETEGTFSDFAVHTGLPDDMAARDRNLVMKIIYGSLRWQGLLDYVIAGTVTRPWRKVDAAVKVLLRLSLYQMWQMDRIPDHALIHDAVELAKKHLACGTEAFINGVLRRLARDRIWMNPSFRSSCSDSAWVSLPEWLWRRWSGRFGVEVTTEYALSLNQPPPTAIRLKRSGNASENRTLPTGARSSGVVPDAFLIDTHAEVNGYEDKIVIQDEASQLIPHLFGDIAGWKVWDACAAPGGKSAILRNLCGASGWVISTDLCFARANNLFNFLVQEEGSPFDVFVLDARGSAPIKTYFDAVLVDAPCSGLGTLRRNPEIKWRIVPEKLDDLQNLQTSILAKVSERVRPGGLLLYSTCSTEPEENEDVVEEFLRTHPEFSLRRPTLPHGIRRMVGSRGMVRTFPGLKLWDGFFAALMVRS